MPRPRPPGQLEHLVDAAGRVFARKGLRRARMSEIANEAGVAPGTLYHYFESKEALFYYVLDRGTGAGNEAIPEPLPVPDPGRERLEKLLQDRAHRASRFRALDEALERRRVNDARAELEGVVRDLYDRIARGQAGTEVLEASALDQPDLADMWFREVRGGLLARLEDYIERRCARGHFARPKDVRIAARYVLETCVYFARKRHRDPLPEALADDDAIRATVVDLVVKSLIAAEPRDPELRDR
jgi:AcrR family transcriptional regulator